MSHPIEEQRQIIELLYEAIISVAPQTFSNAVCRFGYHRDNGSVDNGLTFFIGDAKKYASLQNDQIFDLVSTLHAKMKAHTGGDWDAFTLLINEDGSVETKFEHPES